MTGPCITCNECPEDCTCAERDRYIARALLRECIQHLWKFDSFVSNGSTCPSCLIHGGGSKAEHDPKCEGVRLLRDVRREVAR